MICANILKNTGIKDKQLLIGWSTKSSMISQRSPIIDNMNEYNYGHYYEKNLISKGIEIFPHDTLFPSAIEDNSNESESEEEEEVQI